MIEESYIFHGSKEVLVFGGTCGFGIRRPWGWMTEDSRLAWQVDTSLVRENLRVLFGYGWTWSDSCRYRNDLIGPSPQAGKLNRT